MLVSHRKRFIFIKTAKTAGTSVEVYFEKYCFPAGQWQYSHARAEYCSASGIVGVRGHRPATATYWNHMPAEKIRQAVGETTWQNYFKFTVIRNPFDRLVSAFFHDEKKKGRGPAAVQDPSTVRRFRHWLKVSPHQFDPSVYRIDGQIAVDHLIRFESLLEGMSHVCDRLGIDFQPSEVPQLKTGCRDPALTLTDLYDEPSIQLVKDRFAWELDQFGYAEPTGAAV